MKLKMLIVVLAVFVFVYAQEKQNSNDKIIFDKQAEKLIERFEKEDQKMNSTKVVAIDANGEKIYIPDSTNKQKKIENDNSRLEKILIANKYLFFKRINDYIVYEKRRIIEVNFYYDSIKVLNISLNKKIKNVKELQLSYYSYLEATFNKMHDAKSFLHFNEDDKIEDLSYSQFNFTNIYRKKYYNFNSMQKEYFN
jgi:hypothetical protein